MDREGWWAAVHGVTQSRTRLSDFHYLHNIIKMSAAAAAAKSLQSCPTLCDPMDCSPPGSSVHVVFQARVLEWGAIAFSDEVAYLTKIPLVFQMVFKNPKVCKVFMLYCHVSTQKNTVSK